MKKFYTQLCYLNFQTADQFVIALLATFITLMVIVQVPGHSSELINFLVRVYLLLRVVINTPTPYYSIILLAHSYLLEGITIRHILCGVVNVLSCNIRYVRLYTPLLLYIHNFKGACMFITLNIVGTTNTKVRGVHSLHVCKKL